MFAYRLYLCLNAIKANGRKKPQNVTNKILRMTTKKVQTYFITSIFQFSWNAVAFFLLNVYYLWKETNSARVICGCFRKCAWENVSLFFLYWKKNIFISVVVVMKKYAIKSAAGLMVCNISCSVLKCWRSYQAALREPKANEELYSTDY